MVNQGYETKADGEYVILGNSALLKCIVPSFVADLIQIVSWEDSSGNVYSKSTLATGIWCKKWISQDILPLHNHAKILYAIFRHNFTKQFLNVFSAVNQEYETDVGKEYVIMGNSALMKCEIPSFVADLVQIISWIDSEGNSFSHKKYGTTILNTLKVSPSCMHGMTVILNSTTSCARELGGCLKEHEIVIVLTSLKLRSISSSFCIYMALFSHELSPAAAWLPV